MTFCKIVCFSFFMISFSFVDCSINLYCRDEENQKVDWFVNYKIPKLERDNPGTYLAEGKAYTYITSSNPDKWRLSSNSITTNASMLGLTVEHLLKVEKKASYVFYNDEPPGQNGTAVGHMKGIVAFDGTSGFWLVHSIPKFSNSDKYGYPNNALSYGQSILCITLKTSALNDICKQLLISHPKIYKYGVTDEVLKLLDAKAKTIFTDKPAFTRHPSINNSVVLKSTDDEIFISFAKHHKNAEDIYSQMIAPSLATSLVTETWRRGSGTYLPPSCDYDYSVLDIMAVNMTVSGTNIIFKSTDDHSKWAISTASSQYWICVGDMNRMQSQAKRGGGAICFQSKTVWNSYNSIIFKTDKCPT